MTLDYDAVIIGAGPVGLVSALDLAREGFYVAVLERQSLDHLDQGERWYALGHDVWQWLQSLGISLPYCAIDRVILSSDLDQSCFTFDAAESSMDFLMSMANSQHLQKQLLHTLCTSQLRADIFWQDSVQQWHKHENSWGLELSSGQILRTPLVIAADGKSSSVRQHFHNTVTSWSFPQKAAVLTFDPMPSNVGYEHFFEDGSLALLPIPHGQGCAIWMGKYLEHRKNTQQQIESIQKQIVALIAQPIDNYGSCAFFDMSMQRAYPGVFYRGFLLGDALCTMHPIAGQGLNVGLRHARCTLNALKERKKLGLDWGLGLSGAFMNAGYSMGWLMQGFTAGVVYGLSLWHSRTLWRLAAWSMQRFPGLRSWMVRYASGG